MGSPERDVGNGSTIIEHARARRQRHHCGGRNGGVEFVMPSATFPRGSHASRPRPWLAVAGAAVIACGPPAKIVAPPPSSTADSALVAEEAAPLSPTYASAPVSVDLRLLLGEIEHTIPRRIGSLKERLLVSTSPRTWVALEVQRGPLDIAFGSHSMTLNTTLTYRGRVWIQVPLTKVSASCGTGEVQPRVRVSIRTSYAVDPTWHIRTSSRLVSLVRASDEERDECHVTFVGIDVTGKVLAAARDAIEKALATADAQLALVDVRGAVAPVWASLQQPIALGDTTLWLTLRPRAVGVGSVAVHDSVAHATVTLLAEPQILSGTRPAADSAPLPDLSQISGHDTLVARMDASLSYATANEILRRELLGTRIRVRGRRIVIEDLAMHYIGHNRVSLGVILSGAVEGLVYFVGTPIYDPLADAITVPDLDYDVKTANALVAGIHWLAGNKLRDELRRQARVPAGAMLDLARGAANQEITRTLADGVQLSGAIGSARALVVRATAGGLRAQATGGGSLGLYIALEKVFADVHIPRKPLKGIDEVAANEKSRVEARQQVSPNRPF
jgi:hypothetical protein